MKKTLSKIITMLLVVTMLFCIMATTVLAAREPGGGSGGSSGGESGSISTGWCDISYDKNGVTVIVYPDVDAILGINKAQLKEVLDLLIDAAKTIVVDDLKDQILGTANPTDPDVSVGEGTTAANIWEKAFGAYITSKYGSADTSDYIEFLKTVINDDTDAEIGAFIDYACKLLKSAVSIGAIKLEELPESDKLGEKVVKIFNDEVNARIGEVVEEYVITYVAWLEDPANNAIDASIESLVTGQVKAYVETKVDAYIANGFVLVSSPDAVDRIIANYMDDEIYATVDTWIKNYANGLTNPANVNAFIEAKLEEWIDEIATNYGSATPPTSPVYDALKAKVDALVDEKLDEYLDANLEGYINAYLNETALDAEVKAEIEYQLENNCPELIYELYWDKRIASDTFVSGSIWETIDSEVRTSFIEALMDAGLTQPQAESYYDGLSAADCRSEMESDPANKVTAINFIKNEVAGLTPADWKGVWDGLDENDQDTIIAKIKVGIKDSVKESSDFIAEVRNAIKEYWNADTNEGAARRVEAINYFVTYDAGIYASELENIIFDAKTDPTYTSLITTKIDEYLGDNTVDTLRGVIATLDPTKLQSFKDAVSAEAEKVMGDQDVRDEAFESFFGTGVTEAAVTDRITNDFIPLLIADYEVAIDELRSAPTDVDISTLISYVQKVSIGGYTVYENGTVKSDSIKPLLKTLPTPSEIANMSDSEMKLSYDISIVTDFATTNFSVTASLGGGFDAVRKAAKFAAKILDECIDFSYNNGTFTLDVKVPAKFSELALRAIKSDRVPEELKNKVFAAMSKNPDDVYALMNSITFEELLSLLDYVDFEDLINSEYLKDIEALEGLTAEQVKEKAREYEAYYNKLIEIVNKVYTKYVPDKYKDKTLFDLYDGNGEFSYNGSHSVNIESVLEKITPKYAALISSFLDVQTVSATLDLSVDFAKVGKIEYVVGGVTHRAGFLPVGADVAYFAGITEYDGKAIIGWIDASETPYTTMPDSDVTLYPLFEEENPPIIVNAVITPSGVSKVYDGNSEVLSVSLGDFVIPEGAVVTYQWYKDAVAVADETESTIAVLNVNDSGLYNCVVIIQVAGSAPVLATSEFVTVSITKNSIDFSDYHWSEGSFVYDGTEKSVYLVDEDDNKLEFGVIYVNNSEYQNKATNAGTYIASVTVDSSNFIETGSVTPLEWTIAKAKYDMSGVFFKNAEVAYDGKEHSLIISGTLPEGVVANYSENSFVAPGTYTVTVTFTGNANYEEIAPMSAVLKIYGFVVDHIYKDNNGNTIVQVTALDGVLERYTMYSKDVTPQYNYVVNDGLFGDGKVGYVLSAYDIFFADGAIQEPVNGNFTVKLLIPEHLREKADSLKVVHIGDNNEVTDMEATREGDYFVFDTTHFSVYAIVEIGDAPIPEKDLDLSWLWILIAVLVVLLIVAIIIILVIKKRRGNEPEEPIAEKPTLEEPVAEEPVVEEPVVEEPVAEEPVVEEPVVEEPVAEEPVVEEPVAEEPVVEEPVVEEPVVEEPVVEELVQPVVVPVVVDGPVVGVRYRTSFMSRLIQSEEPIQDYYTEIKNALLSYKGVKAKSSWNFESFNKGRIQCAKLNVKGNALQVYLGLDPNEYNANKYHFTDVSDKPKLDKVPMLLKVKSDRGLKYALELVEEMMTKFEIEKVETKYVDYHMPYETTEELAARDLVKVILPAGVKADANANFVKVDVGEMLDNVKTGSADSDNAEAVVVESPVVEEPVVEEIVVEDIAIEEPAVEEPIVIDAEHVDMLITDEEAAAKIEIVEKSESTKASSGNKLVEINLDTICENFEDGDTVTLEELKAKHLVNKKAGRIKILARGIMTKKLTIYADKFSLQAVKMITLAGGHADQYK